ncbi:chymotrypsin-like elastase family member 2A, partial [Stegostoma tigrinum]|uniref:chymotrypsin-like elastase family member 2A n=1 Tax=Stegostoma tigrinum TaxID=3053191 RepID=UPI00286FF843
MGNTTWARPAPRCADAEGRYPRARQESRYLHHRDRRRRQTGAGGPQQRAPGTPLLLFRQLQPAGGAHQLHQGHAGRCAGLWGARPEPEDEADPGRVYGGESAEERQWPWQVRLVIQIQPSAALGAGSLVSPTWVLTAAHNMFDADRIVNASAITASLGSTKGHGGELRKVSEIHVHPLYSNEEATQNENFAYDIALVKLVKPVTFNSRIAPVCLPCTEEVSNFLPIPAAPWESQCTYQDRILTGYGGGERREVTGYISGWGLTGSGRISKTLQHGRISIQHRSQCRRDNLHPSLLCAKGDGVDACRGDSGGPFTIKIKQRWIQ